MPYRIARASVLLVSSSLFFGSAAVAQEKSAGKRLEMTTSSAAAKAALASALDEVANFGGAHRTDARLKAIVDADPNFGLGRAIYGGWSTTLNAAERNAEFARALKDAAGSSTAELLYIAALREWRAGRSAVARDLVDVVLKQAPDDPDVTWFRILIAANAAEGLRIGEAALKHFPDYAPIHNFMGYRFNTAGRQAEAVKTIERYVTLAPSHPNSHDSNAEILQLIGRLDEAEKHYEAALSVDANFEVAHEGMAEIAVLRGNYAAARSHLTAALGIAKSPARRLVLQREIAATHLYEGKLKEAKATMTAVVTEAEASSINALADKRTIAVITALEGNTAQAARLYAAAVPPNPGPVFPLSDAIFHTLLKHPADVARSVAAMEANAAAAPDNADAQQAAHAARVLGLIARNDLSGARAAHQQVTAPAYKAASAAALAHASNKAGDKANARAAMIDVEAFDALNLNAAFARVIAKRK
jgi:tetratricopeptide (TPR) repeat protein